MKLVAISLLLIHYNCAAILSGTEEKFRVRSQIPGTEIYINNQKVGIDLVEHKIQKKERIILKVHKEGCKDFEYEVQKVINENSFYGFLLDLGIITILTVDWLITGALWSSENTNFILDPDCGKVNISPN